MSTSPVPGETGKAIVYMRDVRWDVVVPLGLEWEFMKAFGEAFRLNCPMEGYDPIRPVDSYYEHGGGWHIKVVVNETKEICLLKFCQNFFGSRGIPFREPEAVVHSMAVTFLGLYGKQVELTMKIGETSEVLKGRVTGVGPTCVELDLQHDHLIPGQIVNVFFKDITNATLADQPSA